MRYASKMPFTTLNIVTAAILLQALSVASVVVPSSNCYTFDNSSRIVDFTSWIGHPFEYEGKNSDLVVRFCKDVESRSQTGYVNFGRFDKFNYFVAGSGQSDFIQGFYNGDLMSCEQSYDKMGRTAEVTIKCGGCQNGECQEVRAIDNLLGNEEKCKIGGKYWRGLMSSQYGRPGCICSVTYESNCRALVELAIPCEKPGARVFQGFTVGFHPRSWELVYNGLTQFGFEKSRLDFSFQTEQSRVVLYMTAVASFSSLVHKPSFQVLPDEGLEVRLSGSAANGKPPTTLSPTMLIVDWNCLVARDTPYEVNITIPVEGYEPVQFFLTKMCEYKEEEGGSATRGWAIFGILSCIFFVSSTLFCCGGFIYKTRVERQRGLDALPGMTLLSACLETVSGVGQGYSRPEDLNNAFSSEASWERPPPPPAQGARRPTERKYGAI